MAVLSQQATAQCKIGNSEKSTAPAECMAQLQGPRVFAHLRTDAANPSGSHQPERLQGVQAAAADLHAVP